MLYSVAIHLIHIVLQETRVNCSNGLLHYPYQPPVVAYAYGYPYSSHPKRNLSKQSVLTKNWKIVKGKTSELVGNSKAVIAHNSQSINYAVLNNKPLIFLTTNQLENSDQFENINSNSNYFQKKKINVSNIDNNHFKFNKSEYLKINKKLYDKYIKNFIAFNKNKNFKQILKKII